MSGAGSARCAGERRRRSYASSTSADWPAIGAGSPLRLDLTGRTSPGHASQRLIREVSPLSLTGMPNLLIINRALTPGMPEGSSPRSSPYARQRTLSYARINEAGRAAGEWIKGELLDRLPPCWRESATRRRRIRGHSRPRSPVSVPGDRCAAHLPHAPSRCGIGRGHFLCFVQHGGNLGIAAAFRIVEPHDNRGN